MALYLTSTHRIFIALELGCIKYLHRYNIINIIYIDINADEGSNGINLTA